MLKKTIEYEDYNGEKRKEDFYFNLSKAELMEMELSTTGGMEQFIRRMMRESDNRALTQMFKDIILKSYGVKSADGKRFIKNDSLREEFEQTEAYAELFVELASNAEKAAEFIRGVVPANLAKEVGEVKESDIKSFTGRV